MDDKNIVKNFRDDLILFKNETLKDLKNTEKSLLEKYKNTEYLINEKIEIFEKQFKNFNDKIINILAFIDGLKDVNSNINSLLKYKNKSENSIIDLELKLRSLDKESHDSLYSISSILKNSVIYPAVIGPTAKHKTFHDLIDFILLNISQLKQFKDRITKEVSENRIRQDNNFANLKGNFDTLTEKTKALVVNEIVSIEKKNNSFFKLYDEKFQDFRMDNAKNALIIKNTEQLVESFRQQFKEMDVTKNDFIKKNEEINQQLKQQNKEITTIKEKYQSLANYVKQIKFRNDNQNGNISGNLKTSINVNNDTKNNQNEEDLEKNIDFNELSSSNKELMKIKLKKNESGLKAYIRGKISINQLQTLQNRNNFKSVESFKNNNNVQTEEDLKNKTNFFSEKTKRAVNINKEETKINSQRKESNKLRIQNLLNEDNNLYNNTIASQDLESYLKIDTLSSEQRKHHENIISNPRIIKTQNIRNISLKVEGNEILNINNPVDQKNKKYKSIIQDVKNIIESNNSNNNSRLNNNLSGFPKIVTNQGERIIISSHPVYHRHKFTKNVNQNILSLNRTIQRFYSNSKENKYSLNNDKKTPNILFKENKYIDENFNNFIKKNTGNNISIKKNNNNNKNDIKNTLFNNGNKNEEGHNLIDTKERNNSFQNSKDNRYFKLMTYSDKNKKTQ